MFYDLNGKLFTEQELINYIQEHSDEIYKVPSTQNYGDLDTSVTTRSAIAIPLWAIGHWVIPFIGTIIITAKTIHIGGKLIKAGSALFDTVITSIKSIVFSNAKVVTPNDKLPNQGKVTDKNHKKSPPVDAGKQGKHVPRHNNNDSNKSQWGKGKNGVKETQDAWNKGITVKPDGSVKTYDFKKPVGPKGETKVRVHASKNGLLHGYPVK